MSNLKSILVILSFFLSGTSFGATASDTVQFPNEINYVTTDAAERAEAEFQIRRIKNLLISQEIDGDKAFDQLEKLQRSLHGSR
jgi:hypothetical protein